MLSCARDLVGSPEDLFLKSFRLQSTHRRMVSRMSKTTFLKKETLRGKIWYVPEPGQNHRQRSERPVAEGDFQSNSDCVDRVSMVLDFILDR